MDAIETIEYKGLKIEIFQDEDALNPRTEYDNAGIMVCWHRNYDLGDKHEFCTPDEFNQYKAITPDIQTGIILPLFLMDHSGLAMSTGSYGDPWDSGQVGWIYCGHAKCVEEWGEDFSKAATDYLKCEVETYSQYLQGDVYGYVITSPDGSVDESCWGFYGTDDCMSQAKSAADGVLKWRANEEAMASRYMAL